MQGGENYPILKSLEFWYASEAAADQVSNFLDVHQDFLERYIMEEVEVEQLERWIIRKSQRLKKKLDNSTRNGRKTSLSRWKFCVHADKRKMLQDLTQSLQLKPTRDHVLWELAQCISSAVSADGFREKAEFTGTPPHSRQSCGQSRPKPNNTALLAPWQVCG
ncbi:hypothetical protein NQ317_014779 [Molorchus minor]|uniref:Uncharacterized protein n=1 Tax=Molorchus minor TaxID=1323400 RepID=A0ABQ9J631_9CUCU|nr:hypothetical protein NQ317_014779 [Molorchus minor]